MRSFRAILDVLVSHEVEFIVVGGVAGVLHGAPLITEDIDILYRLTESNQKRLLGALTELDAVFRGDARRIAPNASHLESRGHKLLTTRFGDFDCLATIESDTTYDDLLTDSMEIRLGESNIRVVSLRRLIEIKERLERPKDQLALLHLRATLEENEKKRDG